MARFGYLLAVGLLAFTTFAQDAASRTHQEVPGGIYHKAIPAGEALPLSKWASWDALRTWGSTFVRKGLPADGLAFFIGLAVTSILVVSGFQNRRRGLIVTALLMAPAIPLVGLVPMQFFGVDPHRREAFTLAFTCLYTATAAWAVFSWMTARNSTGSAWRPKVSEPLAKWLALTAVVGALAVTAVRRPDDCGVYSNLGAQRWIESGTLPYGDPALRGGAAATYGPVLYGLHAVAQVLVSPTAAFPNDHDAIPMDPAYVLPNLWATKLVAALSLIGICVGTYFAVRRMADKTTAYLVIVLIAASAYVLGLGGKMDGRSGADATICGVGYVSHLTPAAFVMLALASLQRPFLAGTLIALGAGTVYWPAFLVPLWIAYFRGKSWRDALLYITGFAVTGLVLAGFVILATRTNPGENAVSLFFKSTLEHQEGMDQYGSSPFSFWGVHPDLAAAWHHPLLSFGGSLTKPTFLVVVATSLLGFHWGFKARTARLAALSALIACVVQLWKTHAGGSYVEWALPMLLVALLADRGDAPSPEVPRL